MREPDARRELKAFADHYDYNVSYMANMLDISPDAYFKFSAITALAQHREAAPADAAFAAKLTGAVAEDCGPCVQLVVRMAQEAGMDDAQIEAVLTRDPSAMNQDATLGFRFADALVRRQPYLDGIRDEVEARWGEAAVIDLTFAVQIGRVFPMVKAGLGFAKTCERVRIGDHAVAVRKEAA